MTARANDRDRYFNKSCVCGDDCGAQDVCLKSLSGESSVSKCLFAWSMEKSLKAAGFAFLFACQIGCGEAQAGFGAYTLGLGARSTGAGGIVYSLVQDTVPLSSNPATARLLGDRVDFALEYDSVKTHFYLQDNLLGPDQKFTSNMGNFLFPYAGFSVQLSDALAFAVTGFLAGAGAGYDDNPFARFGGDQKSSFQLFQVGVSNILAYEILPNQNIGISLNVSYDAIELKGLGKRFAMFSEAPEHFTDQGRDGTVGFGATIGWYGQLAPWLAAGVGYRSKTFSAKRIERYEGLLPDRGSLEFPAFFGGGFALTPTGSWTLAVEAQRYEFSKIAAFGNRLEQFPQHQFGSKDGPGFGWRSQNVIRTAVEYEVNPQLALRLGFAGGTQVARSSDTLFGAFATGVTTTHYTMGASWSPDGGWEWTGALAWAPNTRVNGKDSIPILAGGGEADVEISAFTLTISMTRSF